MGVTRWPIRVAGVCRTLAEDTKLEEKYVCGVGGGMLGRIQDGLREWPESAGRWLRIQNSRRILIVVYVVWILGRIQDGQ